MVIGGGSAGNVLDLGTATQNKGISWGGSSFNYTNIWSEYSGASLWLGAGLKSKGSSTGFYSSYGGSNFARSAIELESFGGGGIKFFTSGAQTVATDGAITVDERLRINASGQVLVGENSSPDCKLTVTNGTFMIETHTTFYSGSGENGENYPTIFFKGDHSSGNNPAHGKITVRHSSQNTYSGDFLIMPQGYYSGSYAPQEVLRVSAYKRLYVNNESNSTPGLSTNADDIVIGYGTQSGETGISMYSTTASGIRFNDNSGTDGAIEYAHSDREMRFNSANGVRLALSVNGQ